MENEEQVYLIAGIVNATGQVLFWKDEINIEVGNYAIVENVNGYDLVKVIGRVKTTTKDASKLSKTRYENMKRAVCEVNSERLETIRGNKHVQM